MENFCTYCGVVMVSLVDFQAHCQSESHQLTIMSDEGREWKFRPPARGVTADQYSLCIMFSNTGKCRLGQQCCDAHGEEELNEWKERYSYRQMKMQHAKECRLQGGSYTEQLLEKWLASANPLHIMKEKLEDVDITIEPETNLTVSEKNCCREWTIHISTKNVLHHIALLHETHRNHFRISQLFCEQSPGNIREFDLGSQCQEWSNTDVSDVFPSLLYICKVRFITSIYGTFRQAIVFDFGYEPVLIQKLSVDVVSISDLEKLQQARESVVSFTERWSNDEVVIIPFENKPYSLGEPERNLLSCYPAPDASKFNLTQAVMEPVLTKLNYNSRLHELLCIEEMAQYELLSRYNVKAHLNVVSCYLLTPNSAATAKYAHNGELFANMELSSVLSEDSSSGRLILTNCSTVLLAPLSTKGLQLRKVYEATIEDKGKTAIYIRLSKQCTEDLQLREDDELVAEVQFQLNRLPLCEMHFAVDRLHPSSLVFPEIQTLPPVLWNTSSEWCGKFDSRLNKKQQEAILAITAPLSIQLPPILIIGPFGTGKTFTLAQAVRHLVSDPHSRVLVCTHSNSAADIYIREYFHPQVAEGCLEATPLRIYYRHRWVATVHPTVLQYCLVSTTECGQSFNMPTLDDVKKYKVIVTTLSTSRYLVQLGLGKNFFTHILIDEAAQAMECEAIMPLSLASENTRIVLAGDHMQLSPEVYSHFAEKRNLHTSLLERLYDLYPDEFPCKILLCENYRSHKAIIQYTSELFYDNHLKASAQQPRHEKYYPLTFFTARGEDVQDVNSTAYHNNAEVYEIVERVIELKRSWPEVWGDQDETSIGVVTPYYDQVVRIRAELRKKKLHGVSVERVLNVQGKEFRVIFLSAVRTHQTCNGPKMKSESDLNHGFLSNARLLNTAITRAQSLVAVVGDPVSLCSVGKCRKLWEKFIFTCHKEKSLFGITWDSLRSHLDSMELKKNFTLNPLAPEFVPGRLFHGQPNLPPPPTEDLCMQASQIQQPWYLFPYPSSFQGPPMMQSSMPHVMPPPHPYNMGMNCQLGPSVMSSPPPPFQGFPCSGPTPPTLPQSTPLPVRMSPVGFPRRVCNPRLTSEQVIQQTKEMDRAPLLGRPIKRGNIHPFNGFGNRLGNNMVNEEKVQNLTNGIEESRIFFNRNEENFHIVNDQVEQLPNPTSVQGNMFNVAENLNKTDIISIEKNCTFMKKIPQFSNDMSSFNGFLEHQSALKPKNINGTTRFNTFHQRTMMESDLCSVSTEMIGSLPNIESLSLNQSPNLSYPNHEPNNYSLMAKDRVMINVVDGISPASIENPVEKRLWNTENTPSLEMLRTSLQEKLGLLEKILPVGTDLRSFLDSPESARAFFGHLLVTENPTVAKRFMGLMMSIKQDQEMLLRNNAFVNNAMERNNSLRNFSNGLSNNTVDVPFTLSSRIPFNKPPTNNKVRPDAYENYDPFRYEMPISVPGILKNTEMNGETKNGYVCMQPRPDEIFVRNGPTLMDKSVFGLRSTMHQPFPGECLTDTVRRAEFERQQKDSQKELWAPLVHNSLQPPGESYLSKFRNMSSSTSTSSEGSRSPFVEQASSSNEAHMTAFSVSYPDIPNILTTHVRSSESITPAVDTSPAASSRRSSSQRYLYEIPANHNTNCNNIVPTSNTSVASSSLQYSHSAVEGMTYAKILRSPHAP